ncbi:hypothetical protein BV25DRAFT_1913711, partial [Artomyces pyxidatus]
MVQSTQTGQGNSIPNNGMAPPASRSAAFLASMSNNGRPQRHGSAPSGAAHTSTSTASLTPNQSTGSGGSGSNISAAASNPSASASALGGAAAAPNAPNLQIPSTAAPSHMHVLSTQQIQAIMAFGAAGATHIAAPTVPVPPRPVTPKLTEADEAPERSYERKVEISQQILFLYKEKQYLPMHIFTNQNLRLISQQPSKLLHKVRVSGSDPTKGNSVMLIDPSLLPGDELTMSQTDWTEAWGNYLRFIVDRYDTPVYNRWNAHFERLRDLPDLKSCLPAVLEFDAELRRDYQANPFRHDDSTWYHRLQTLKIEHSTTRSEQRISMVEAKLGNLSSLPFGGSA